MVDAGRRALLLGIGVFVVGMTLGALLAGVVHRGISERRLQRAEQEHAGRATELEHGSAALRERLAFAELHLQLGEVMLHAHRNNFGVAQRQGAELFQRLGHFGRTAAETELAEQAAELAQRQAEILGDLAALSPGAAEKLGDVYVDWRETRAQR
jgi:hypothetical protein